MDSNDWSTERWRIALVLFVAFVGGILTGYWSLSLILSLVAYIAWLLYKLKQLHIWLIKGASPSLLPDSNGIWERITQQIQNTHKKSDRRKDRMVNLLKRLQGIITALPYATVVLNGNNEIDWANGISQVYLNVDIKKDRGQRIDNIIRLPQVNNLLETKSTKEIEVSLPTGDYGLERQVAIQIIPVQGDLKLLVARDVSERATIYRMRKNFIANASHELRTPLTVIAGYLEIMQEDDHLPDSLQPAVLAASDQSIRMQRIIEDLLTLSRLENSELSDNSSSIIDVPSVLNRICHDEATLITGDTHIIEKDIDESLKIKGSDAEIISVCSNLVHNSVRHTQDGTKVKVIWKKSAKGEGCLSVVDDGQGIPAEHLVHLTERFYRVDKGRSRDKGGTGLGLAIVQHIAQRHGAKLDIKSEVSKGSTFSVCFPASRVVDD
ncbi:phosphate regulon sensor histidine kinase PhoR [uncultured Cocleimonas sp.]|uniref:phosphate regulon sensor histidine kinase PhoR n=1 Tax=uncultured Cocleimonas sp. TaxID=1051587 RepID=UPI00261ED5C7|nr:phosphate regulon sensor histidine kinase PhoR [uncultured Cocleimonas sp.]